MAICNSRQVIMSKGLKHVSCIKYYFSKGPQWLAHTTVGLRLIYSCKRTGAFQHLKVGGFLRIQLLDFVLYWRHISKVLITNNYIYVQLTHTGESSTSSTTYMYKRPLLSFEGLILINSPLKHYNVQPLFQKFFAISAGSVYTSISL